MSIFGIDWNWNGKIDDMDTIVDLFMLHELLKDSEENKNPDDDDRDFTMN